MTTGRWTTALLVAAAALCAGSPSYAQITGKLVNPNVLLVIDSSRSMDWLQSYTYPPPSALEQESLSEAACDAANAGSSVKQTSWQQLLDVMLGSIPPNDFHCFLEEPDLRPSLQIDTLTTASMIPANTDEYTSSPSNHFRAVSCADENWNTMFNQCIGPNPAALGPGVIVDGGKHWCRAIPSDHAVVGGRDVCFNYHPLAKARLANGILERYRTLARFGVMTYDNKPAPLSQTGSADPATGEDPEHKGWFDYGESRKWDCKKWSGLPTEPGAGCTWNAGARSENLNAVGRLWSISEDMEGSNHLVRDVLSTTEPLYCSPVGALLDDVGYYFNNNTRVRPAGDSGSDLFYACRPKLVIFISDGRPNQDFEFPQDYCDANPPLDPPEPGETTTPPDDPYSCPWNSSVREVTELRKVLEDLMPAEATVDPVYFVVIGFNTLGKGDVVCEPAWNYSTNNCDVDERCIQIETTDNPAECLDETPPKFLTPRQFLNELALEGWPATYDVQPPWRDGTPPSSDLCSDEELGDAGVGDDSCGGEDGDGRGNGAIFVNGPSELSAVLDLLLSTVTAATATRTEVVTTDQVGGGYDEEWSAFVTENESGDAVAQYEFNSGFQVIGGKPWRGFLYRQGYACSDGEGDDDSGPPADKLVEFHSWLTNQTDRRIYTITDGTLADATEVKYNDDTTFVEGQAKTTLKLISPTSGMTDCDVGGPTGLCATNVSIVTALKSHLYGETPSARHEHKLADIYNSTPAILGPPLERLNVGSYQEFQSTSYVPAFGGSTSSKRESERPPFLYVGTNDGVLHSFNVRSEEDQDVEMWGYVPNALLSGIVRQFPISWSSVSGYTAATDSNLYQHIFGVDGTPVAADMRLFRLPNGVDDPKYWRSIVIGGLGKGGVGYYALDVTNPEDVPRFRWEISERFPANNAAASFLIPTSLPYAGSFVFGMPVGKPALTYVYVNEALPVGTSSLPTKHELAVAILPGGYKSDPAITTGVAIVRVGDGKLIRYLQPNLAADLCSKSAADTKVTQLVGEPAVPYPLRSLAVNDEAFLGDDRGRLWRIDMSKPNAVDWCLEMFFDTLITRHFPYKDCIPGTICCTAKLTTVTNSCSAGEIAYFAADDEWGTEACTGLPCANPSYPFPRVPIVNAPTIVQDEVRNNIILFGTGQLDGVEALDHHRIFSLTQKINYNVTEGTSGQTQAATQASAPTINWWLGEPIPSTGTLPLGATELAQKQQMLDLAMGFNQADSLYPSLFNFGEKLLGRIAVFNENAYFTTFIPAVVGGSGPVDACQSGGSRIWGVTFGANTSPTAWTAGTFGKLGGKVFDEFSNQLLSGVKIVRRPSCSGQAEFQLVAQRANPSSSGGSGPSATGAPKISSVSVTIPQTQRGFTTISIDSWSLVFN